MLAAALSGFFERRTELRLLGATLPLEDGGAADSVVVALGWVVVGSAGAGVGATSLGLPFSSRGDAGTASDGGEGAGNEGTRPILLGVGAGVVGGVGAISLGGRLVIRVELGTGACSLSN